MVTSKVEYLGQLRTECVHLASGTRIITDAPVDNHGKGEAFSPTDLVATAYASCMITIMGIYCASHGIDFLHAEATVEKMMSASPRRIHQLVVQIDMTKNGWDDATADKVIRAGKACPVAQTLGDNVQVDIEFKW
jgi:putative redox protein